MDETSAAARELAETIERVNYELARYGKLQASTQQELTDAQMKAKYGMESYSKGTAKAADAVGALASAGMAAGKAMLDGKKGAAAFNDSLGELSKAATAAGVALTFLIPGGPIIKGLIAGLTAITTATLKYAQAANEMADKLYKGYSDLAKSGGAAADGMTGVFEDAKNLGLSMNELGDFVGVITKNAPDLALFAGNVADGRKQLASMGRALEGSREEFIRLGMNMIDVTGGMASYIRLQSRLGQAQGKSTDELAAGAKRYLVEMDALAKATGMQREEAEKALEQVRSQERFRAAMDELRAQGEEGRARAAEVEKTYLKLLASGAKDVAQGFADIQSGALTTEKAVQANILTQGEIMVSSQKLRDGLIKNTEAFQGIGRAAGEGAGAFRSLAQFGAAGDVIGDYAQATELGIRAQQDQTEIEKRVAEMQKGQIAGTDKLTKNQSELITTQIKANEALERFVFAGIDPAQKAMIALAKATATSADKLNEVFGITAPKGATPEAQAQIDENTKELEQLQPTIDKLRETFDRSMKDATLMQRMGFGRTEEQKRAAEELKAAEAKASALKRGIASAQSGAAAGTMPEGATAAPPAPAAAPAPAAPGAAAPAAPGDKVSMGRQELESAGLRVKAGDVQAEGAAINPRLIQLAKKVQSEISGFQYFSGFNDKFHQENSPSSTHTQGLATDFTVAPRPAPDVGRAIVNQLKSMGFTTAIDEYNNPSAKSTAGHFHAAIQAADGGVFTGPKQGYPAELHGTEAVVPLPDGKAIPVKLAGPIPFQAPTPEQLKKAYGDLSGVIPGMAVRESDGGGWTTDAGSVAEQLNMAVREMIATNSDLKRQMEDRRATGNMMSPGEWMQLMLSTPEGKVFAAQNMIGVQGLGQESAESLRLREQYADIEARIRQQDLAALKAGKVMGGSIEDPLSRMELLLEDYVKRQSERVSRGIGDWQAGRVDEERLVEVNQRVIEELQNLQTNLTTNLRISDVSTANKMLPTLPDTMSQDLEKLVKEGSPFDATMKEIASTYQSSMQMISDKIAQAQQAEGAQDPRLLELIGEMVQEQRNTNDINQKILLQSM